MIRSALLSTGLQCRLDFAIDLFVGRTSVTIWAGLLISTNWKDITYNLILVIIDYLMLENFTNGFHDRMFTEKAPVTISLSSLSACTMSRCRYQSIYLGLQRSLSPLTQYQQLKLSLHFQVLVFPVPLPSSTGVTANASLTKKILALVPDSIRNFMIAYRKNCLHGPDIVYSFLPDLWGYVHGFSYWFDL